MVDVHLVLALVELAMNQEFADAGAVGQVISKFNEIRDNLLSSLNTLQLNEEEA